MRYPRSAARATRPTRMAAGACAFAAVLLASAPALQPGPAAAVPVRTQGCAEGFDCDMSARIQRVDAYLKSRPGVVGYVVRDRVTGAVHSNANADTPFWTASTIKLAIAEDLLNRARVGAIVLTPEDRALMESMLATSNDNAADILWRKYNGQAFVNAFRANGMAALDPKPTPPDRMFPDWGFQQCTPADLDRLMNNVLDHMHPDDRAYLIDRMRHVDANQHWGVWGAGAAMQPGLKNGWSDEQGGWVVNSVGFAGPGERYTLGIMNFLGDQGGYTDGEQTTTRVAEILFSGRG
ncbi:class A beta-lactamase-related serine hydrolase [Nocardia sp. CDC159]|uniref:Class A beta-lactamase-related serine hydrolase n=1 Tax=Nocardia pulmonis TaxID=2951408 RepID=A0A9X2IWV2_9NOCA|nr:MULTISPECIES: class A beta-lactamase-related serine hydrolase [Nocardia]MCM6772256.1 class A beta-lactamase-related serine hydrolase [Nocardia pulmonis]MCM6785086.1 class A beta-lactamase-related serine hydrolase [Nocardia sp. CDC159]